MRTRNMLYRREYDINDAIHIKIPTVGEILECEDGYYSIVAMLTAMPIDMMVQLDDIGIDFTTIDEYDLFLLLVGTLKEQDTSLVFADLDLKRFQAAVNEQNGNIVLVDESSGVVIDRAIHAQIAGALRKIHHLEKDNRKPANGEAKEYMIERARKKMRRQRNRENASQLEELIVALVNTDSTTMDLRGHENFQSISSTKACDRLSRKSTMTTRCTASMLAQSAQKT